MVWGTGEQECLGLPPSLRWESFEPNYDAIYLFVTAEQRCSSRYFEYFY